MTMPVKMLQLGESVVEGTADGQRENAEQCQQCEPDRQHAASEPETGASQAVQEC